MKISHTFLAAHYHSRRYDYDHDVDFDFIGSSNAGSGAKESRFRVPLGPGDRLGIVLFIQQLESLFLQLCGFRRDQSSGVLEMYPTTEKMFAAGVRFCSRVNNKRTPKTNH